MFIKVTCGINRKMKLFAPGMSTLRLFSSATQQDPIHLVYFVFSQICPFYIHSQFGEQHLAPVEFLSHIFPKCNSRL